MNQPQTRSVLGKGLASLLPGAAAVQQQEAKTDALGTQDFSNKDRHPGISFIQIDQIKVNPYQPRKSFDEQAINELSQSIVSNGIIQPLVVRRVGNDYQLIAGERRLRAATLAGLKQVPVVIRKSTDRESLELALIENIQRRDLNCIDEAKAYYQLLQEFTLTQEEIARRVGKERATVANHLRLLKLSSEIQDALKNGIISFGHGKAILSLEEETSRQKLYQEIVAKGLSVREAEARASELKGGAHDAKDSHVELTTEADPVAERLKALSQELTRSWSVKVDLKGNENKGKIIFSYKNREELENILTWLKAQKT